MNLGEKIEELRKKEKMTQEKLAEKIGVSRQTLANWESGITNPDIVSAKKIAVLFGVSLDDLVDMESEMSEHGSSVLSDLVGKICFLDAIGSNDYKLNETTPVEVLEMTKQYMKVKFSYKNETITKIIDINLIDSICLVEEEGEN